MPKGAKKGAKISRKAIDQGWSLNPKELETVAKPGKPRQALPEVYTGDEKETASEQVKHDTGSAGGSNVPKYFGRLPNKGQGAAPKAWDAKSKKMLNDNLQLKADLEKAESEAVPASGVQKHVRIVDECPKLTAR